jgi:molybdopterin-containing oxidoreductase family membrane subunit
VTTTVVGIFAHVDTVVKAIHALRQKGFSGLSSYTPVPVDEIAEALEGPRAPVSPVRFFTLIGGLTGTASGFALTIWSVLKWNLVVGGKPIVSIPPFVIIAFELTILLGGLSTLLGLLLTGGLPKLKRSGSYDHRFTVDRFGLVVECDSDRAQAARECLRAEGAEEVRP